MCSNLEPVAPVCCRAFTEISDWPLSPPNSDCRRKNSNSKSVNRSSAGPAISRRNRWLSLTRTDAVVDPTGGRARSARASPKNLTMRCRSVGGVGCDIGRRGHPRPSAPEGRSAPAARAAPARGGRAGGASLGLSRPALRSSHRRCRESHANKGRSSRGLRGRTPRARPAAARDRRRAS
jgi:hypothetical protein